MDGKNVLVPTCFGALRGRLFESGGVRYVLVQRHAKGHATPPHQVPYRAIALGIQSLGVVGCLSTAAVGALRRDWPVGTLAVCTDMIDLSARNVTLFERDVRHTDFSNAFPLSRQMAGIPTAQCPCVYANVNGPRFETPAEVSSLAISGADVVGMTVGTEATVLREAGIPYGCLAIVTNLACGLGEEEPKHEEVTSVVASKSEEVVRSLMRVAESLVGER